LRSAVVSGTVVTAESAWLLETLEERGGVAQEQQQLGSQCGCCASLSFVYYVAVAEIVSNSGDARLGILSSSSS
jgi:hypothetical protein